jgi:hypothetical protein
MTSVGILSEFHCQHIFRGNFLYRFEVLRIHYLPLKEPTSNGDQDRKHCCDKTVNIVDEGANLSDNEYAEVVILEPTVSDDRCSDSLSESSHMSLMIQKVIHHCKLE